ncbi:MAG: choline/carnitine O-acyltransferase [Simkaniaceae bacterium]|nr:choline/carnitine O-acyltransferase [Simkaniaceae bacterium]
MEGVQQAITRVANKASEHPKTSSVAALLAVGVLADMWTGHALKKFDRRKLTSLDKVCIGFSMWLRGGEVTGKHPYLPLPTPRQSAEQFSFFAKVLGVEVGVCDQYLSGPAYRQQAMLIANTWSSRGLLGGISFVFANLWKSERPLTQLKQLAIVVWNPPRVVNAEPPSDVTGCPVTGLFRAIVYEFCDRQLDHVWYGGPTVAPTLFALPGKPIPDGAREMEAALSILGLQLFVEQIRTNTGRVGEAAKTLFDMSQYQKIVGTWVVPKRSAYDAMTSRSDHVLIVRKGHYYALEPRGKSLQQLYFELRAIVKDAEERCESSGVNVLSFDTRSGWFANREKIKESNPESLKIVETSMAVITLEDHRPIGPEESAKTVFSSTRLESSFVGPMLLLSVFLNGTSAAFNGHFTVEALATSRATEAIQTIKEMLARKFGMVFSPPHEREDKWTHKLRPVEFVLDEEMEREVARVRLEATSHMDKVEVATLEFHGFGKGLIKALNQSPDSFVVLAILRAVYQVKGKIPNAYQSLLTRALFRDARTETGRPATPEALAYLKNPNKESFDRAVKAHVKQKLEFMQGKGFDRHMMALVAMAVVDEKVNGTPIPEFLKSYRELEFDVAISSTDCPSVMVGGFRPFKWGGFSFGFREGYLVVHVTAFGKGKAVELKGALSQALEAQVELLTSSSEAGV